MTAQPEPAAKPTAPAYVVTRAADPDRIPGRRDFFEYVGLVDKAASGGKLRAQIMKAKRGLVEDTGWHVHLCDGQFVYMLAGWAKLQMVDGEVIHLEAGDAMYVPGGVPHNEVGASDDMEVLEISIPADMGTEPCPKPDF